MRNLLLSAVAAGACLLPARASAQIGGVILQPGDHASVSRVATRGAAFLSLGVGARALALGGAATATSTDLSSMYWNVAGLGEVTMATAFASHEKLYGNS